MANDTPQPAYSILDGSDSDTCVAINGRSINTHQVVARLKHGDTVATRDRPEAICRGTPVVEEWPEPSDKPHTHRTIGGAIIDCYHETTNLLTSWQFWMGMTLGFPLEHYLYEKVWPFRLITEWLGL